MEWFLRMKNLAVTVVFCVALLFIFVHCRKQEKQLAEQITQTSAKSRPLELNLPDFPILPETADAGDKKAPADPEPVAEPAPAPAPAPAPEPVAEPAPAPAPAPEPAPLPTPGTAEDKQQKITDLRMAISQKRAAAATLEKQLAEDRARQSRLNAALSTISDRLNSLNSELSKVNAVLKSQRYICYTNCIILGSVKFERLMVRPKVDVPNGIYHIRYGDRFRDRNYPRRRYSSGRNRPPWEREHDPNYYRHPKRFEVIYECLIHKLKWVREEANEYHERYPDRYAYKAKQNDIVDKISKLKAQQTRLRDEQKTRSASMDTITRQISELNRKIRELEKEMASLL